MLNHYETVFILTPVLSDVQMKEAVEKFKAVLTENGGTITNEENWGLRKLAYPIQKKSTGFYSLLQFDVEPAVIKVLETQFLKINTACTTCGKMCFPKPKVPIGKSHRKHCSTTRERCWSSQENLYLQCIPLSCR